MDMGEDSLVIRGTFERPDGTSVANAAVHHVFLGDPPSNCGTSFDLEEAPAHTDATGRFHLALTDLDVRYSLRGPPRSWRRGCFALVAAKDARTVGFLVASGEELASSPARLLAVPNADIQGAVRTASGSAVGGAAVEVHYYRFFVGRGPCPNAPVNFWLSRPSREPGGFRERLTELDVTTGPDGKFVIANAPMMPGTLSLTVSHPGYATLEAEHYPFQPTHSLALQAGAVLRLRVALPDGRPAVGLTFNLEGRSEGASREPYREKKTDAGGVCEFRSLPPCGFIARYFGGGEGPWAVPAVRVTPLAEGERREIAVEAVAGSVLCGRVCETGTGEPILQAEVRFEGERYPRTGSTFQACYTDESGEFAYDCPLAPGPLTVYVSAWHQGQRVGRRHTVVIGQEPRTELVFDLPVPRGGGGAVGRGG
jgi:hypothetical protein